jgi:hypothetical protein
MVVSTVKVTVVVRWREQERDKCELAERLRATQHKLAEREEELLAQHAAAEALSGEVHALSRLPLFPER